MIVAIDESGPFRSPSTDYSIFVSIIIRQRKSLYKAKRQEFESWERNLPRHLKNHRGEIKSSSLTDDQLADFARHVVRSSIGVWITPLLIRPSENPPNVVDKNRHVAASGIRQGVKEYREMGKEDMALAYEEFGHWFNKLSYEQFLKIFLLGECISQSLQNAIGHSYVGRFDEELVRLRYLIDKDFIREPKPNLYWHEILRNVLYDRFKREPMPIPMDWERRKHPYLVKYGKNMRELFWDHLAFVESKDNFEVRIADAVATIFHRRLNRSGCHEAFRLIRSRIAQGQMIRRVVLQDFDLATWKYDPADNPWKKISEQEIVWNRVWGILDYHKKNATPLFALNRLFREQVSNAPGISTSTATVRLEQWTTGQLDQTVRKDRSTTGPARLDVAVVVVQWKGVFYLIDGRRRVNTWVAKEDRALHDVFIVEPS
jgi:hypothetical protein